MPYTLMKGLVWILLAVVLGLIIGWLLRDVTARRQVARARGLSAKPDDTELERLRSRVANLEPIVNERDRLRLELDEAQARAAATESRDVVSTSEPAETSPAPAAASEPTSVRSFVHTAESAAMGQAEAPDLAAAAALLGSSIALDDLTAVEGIGPKIAELCHGIGITTWSDLADTEVSLLRTMLTDAGQRFKAHDPTTWPRQAGLLAAGNWAEFKAYTDELDGGRTVT